MEELRTLKDLKDIDFAADEDNVIYGFSEVVKQEAIKWMIADESKWFEQGFDMDDACNFIKHFFNITKEDLI